MSLRPEKRFVFPLKMVRCYFQSISLIRYTTKTIEVVPEAATVGGRMFMKCEVNVTTPVIACGFPLELSSMVWCCQCLVCGVSLLEWSHVDQTMGKCRDIRLEVQESHTLFTLVLLAKKCN